MKKKEQKSEPKSGEGRLSYEQQKRIMMQHFESFLSVNCPEMRGEVVDVLWKGSVLKVSVPGDIVQVTQ